MDEEITLAQAAEVYALALRDGTTCPCCNRYGKIYKRKFNSSTSFLAFSMLPNFKAKKDAATHSVSFPRGRLAFFFLLAERSLALTAVAVPLSDMMASPRRGAIEVRLLLDRSNGDAT